MPTKKQPKRPPSGGAGHLAHAQRMAVARIAVEPPPSRGITLPTLHFMRKDAPYVPDHTR